MTTLALHKIQNLVDQLTPLEQVQLLQYLAPRIVQSVVIQQVAETTAPTIHQAWQHLFDLGDTLETSDGLDQLTLTETIQTMRR